MQKVSQVLKRQLGKLQVTRKKKKSKTMASEKLLEKFPIGSKNNSTGKFVEKKEKIIFNPVYALASTSSRKPSKLYCKTFWTYQYL